MWLIVIAAFGFVVPNGLFLLWLFTEFSSVTDVLSDKLAVAFVLDAFMATAILSYLFAIKPPGAYRWPWFLGLSVLGGLGFGIPFYLWLNKRAATGSDNGFRAWWRTR